MNLPPSIAVAVSGGMDSTALLHCLVRLAAPAGVQVHALHVHHGLHPDADAWAAQVAAQCRRWRRGGRQLVFHMHRLDSHPNRGDSIEAWARRERYVSLAAMARAAGCRVVLLAQHRRDQAETVLLQALRGAGPAGLSAMPREVDRDGLMWIRPWLQQPREAIAAYARRWRLRWVDDPANADPRFARSALRTQIWPVLIDRFSDAETALVAVARRAQEARAIVDEVAVADLARVSGLRGLELTRWVALGPARKANVLRHWLARRGVVPVPETLVHRLLQQLPSRQSGFWPAGELQLGLHDGWLQLIELRPPPAFTAGCGVDLSQPGNYPLPPWPGALRVDAVERGGVPAAWLRQAELRPRRGGEQFQSHARGLPRSLKKQFQDRRVPAWERDGPLVYAGSTLIFVPGLGVDARVLQAPGAPRVMLRWQGADVAVPGRAKG